MFSKKNRQLVKLRIHPVLECPKEVFFAVVKPENLDRPLPQSNISKFWQSWHISLTQWTWDYVFFPILIKTRKSWLATYGSMLTIGIWHAATLNWILWAFAHGTALTGYALLRGTGVYKKVCGVKARQIAMRWGGNLATLVFVSTAWIIVAFKDLPVLKDIVFFLLFGHEERGVVQMIKAVLRV